MDRQHAILIIRSADSPFKPSYSVAYTASNFQYSRCPSPEPNVESDLKSGSRTAYILRAQLTPNIKQSWDPLEQPTNYA